SEDDAERSPSVTPDEEELQGKDPQLHRHLRGRGSTSTGGRGTSDSNVITHYMKNHNQMLTEMQMVTEGVEDNVVVSNSNTPPACHNCSAINNPPSCFEELHQDQQQHGPLGPLPMSLSMSHRILHPAVLEHSSQLYVDHHAGAQAHELLQQDTDSEQDSPHTSSRGAPGFLFYSYDPLSTSDEEGSAEVENSPDPDEDQKYKRMHITRKNVKDFVYNFYKDAQVDVVDHQELEDEGSDLPRLEDEEDEGSFASLNATSTQEKAVLAEGRTRIGSCRRELDHAVEEERELDQHPLARGCLYPSSAFFVFAQRARASRATTASSTSKPSTSTRAAQAAASRWRNNDNFDTLGRLLTYQEHHTHIDKLESPESDPQGHQGKMKKSDDASGKTSMKTTRSCTFSTILSWQIQIRAYASNMKTSLGRLLEIHRALWLPFALFTLWMTAAPRNNMPSNHGHGSDLEEEHLWRPVLVAALFSAYGVVWVIKSNIFPDLRLYNNVPIRGLAPILRETVYASVYLLYPIVASCFSSVSWKINEQNEAAVDVRLSSDSTQQQ
ncbi:unnamed protein product, partial [Amoebophrya sp. A25]